MLLMTSCASTTHYKPNIDVCWYDCDLQGFQCPTTFVPDKLACTREERYVGFSYKDWAKREKAFNECKYRLENR